VVHNPEFFQGVTRKSECEDMWRLGSDGLGNRSAAEIRRHSRKEAGARVRRKEGLSALGGMGCAKDPCSTVM
jgi:hypothetical protein